MATLDLAPMITALRSSPDQFAFEAGSLHHVSSGHRFDFDRSGRVIIQAPCACSYLGATREQEKALFQAFGDWQRDYWRPLEINRQFAEHFSQPLWQRLLVAFTGRLHRACLKLGRHRELHAVAVPAE